MGKGGQPTKYRAEYCTDEFINKYVRHCKKSKELVSLCGLACYIDVSEDTLQEWKKVHPAFSVSTEKVMRISKQMLMNKGLNSTYSSVMARFCLSANHGMAERSDVTSGGESLVDAAALFAARRHS